MALNHIFRIKTLVLFSLLILFLILFSSGFREGWSPNHLLHKDGIQMTGSSSSSSRRKLLMDLQDYDTGPNPRHDPRRKYGGKP
ncbi:uncharacterized protein LOC110601782 [Manihot esculenta]|uniref:Uncharacterized protein n=1 Tax=Manihot esculenta TaxID=3983 RepID=A0A2C9WIZ7_MANES|nr:uncharacterized protein LOC110601782 [Manihot esculenta]OAY59551.1 hypothetical protein MANES_01G040300v8 [Manihot esculenta]